MPKIDLLVWLKSVGNGPRVSFLQSQMYTVALFHFIKCNLRVTLKITFFAAMLVVFLISGIWGGYQFLYCIHFSDGILIESYGKF